MAQEQTKNIGQIAAIWISSNSPENQKLVWYDTSERVHKVYDTASGEWVALNPQVVTNTTISYLQNIVQNSGLSVGKFYFLTDVGTLAIAITTTKIWYVDSHNNYIVNDLAASIQAYVNSTNLYIDGSTGVWNSSTGRLMFSFSTVAYGSNLNTVNDYIVMRRYSGSTWSWIKTKLANLISSVTGNSISWNNGLYFNFSNAINGIKNIAGGIVGYDQYQTNQKEIANQISNVSKGNQEILNTAKTYTDSKTSEAAMLNTAFGRPWTIYSNPPQIPGTGSTLHDVLSILISWAQILQNADKIKIGSGFSSNGRSGNVNYSDTVRSAVEKLVYKVKNQSKFDGITMNDDFDYNGNSEPITFGDTLDTILEKIIYQITIQMNTQNIISRVINTPLLYLTKGFRVQMVDSLDDNHTMLAFRFSDNTLLLNNNGKNTEIATTLLKIVFGEKNIQFTENGITPITGFNYGGKSGDIVDGDTIDTIIEKFLYQINSLKNNKQNWITWKNEDGVDVNRVVRFQGDFLFNPIEGEDNLYEAVINHKDFINEDTWHTGTNVSWIIRNNTLFLRLSRGTYNINVNNTRASVIDISLGSDFNQYIQTVFKSLPWTYQLTGSNMKQKFIKLFTIENGDLGLCINCITTDNAENWTACLGYAHHAIVQNETNVTIPITNQIISIPLSF